MHTLQDAALGDHSLGAIQDYAAHGGIGMTKVYSALTNGEQAAVHQTLSLPLCFRQGKRLSTAAVSAQISLQGQQHSAQLSVVSASVLAQNTRKETNLSAQMLELLRR
tara:strand:- start:82 stop:405 length:324 start_codon:yes stop_codon:yes gene_type:complete